MPICEETWSLTLLHTYVELEVIYPQLSTSHITYGMQPYPKYVINIVMILFFLSSSSIKCAMIKNTLFLCYTYQQYISSIFLKNKKIIIQEINYQNTHATITDCSSQIQTYIEMSILDEATHFLSPVALRLDFRYLDKLCAYKQNFIKK